MAHPTTLNILISLLHSFFSILLFQPVSTPFPISSQRSIFSHTLEPAVRARLVGEVRKLEVFEMEEAMAWLGDGNRNFRQHIPVQQKQYRQLVNMHESKKGS